MWKKAAGRRLELGLPLSWHQPHVRRERAPYASPARRFRMSGWIIVFALLVMAGLVTIVAGHAGAASAKLSSVVFAILFLIAVTARASRGRAW
jgi:hypothetical protein